MHHRALEEVARYHNRTFPTQYEPLAVEPSWKTQDELLPKLAAGQANSKEKETLSEANAQIRTTFDKYINRDAPMGEGHYGNEEMDYYMFPLDITGLMPHINEHLDEFGKKTIYAKYGDEYYEGAINSIQDRTLREHFQTALIIHPKERPQWLMIDATYIKAHQHSAGAVGGNQAMSVSKGGSPPRYIWPWMRLVCRSEQLLQTIPPQIVQKLRI